MTAKDSGNSMKNHTHHKVQTKMYVQCSAYSKQTKLQKLNKTKKNWNPTVDWYNNGVIFPADSSYFIISKFLQRYVHGTFGKSK